MKKLLIPLLLLALISLGYTNAFAQNPELKIIFIDVEQGDSSLIILPNNKTILIDGGERDQTETILATMEENGVTRLDVIVATHPHADHIGGLIGVINSVEVGQVMDSGQIHTTRTFEDLIEAIDANQVPLQAVQQGDAIDLDPSVTIEVLNPPATLMVGADDEDEFNNNSVVIKLIYGEFTALFTGDMEQENEARLSEDGTDLDANVLKVGHHGSRSSSTEAFLDAITPDTVIISLGADNSYGHPHQEAMSRIESVGVEHIFRTDVDGTIILTSDGTQDYTIETTGTSKTVVVPEFPQAILIAGLLLVPVIVLVNGKRFGTWRKR